MTKIRITATYARRDEPDSLVEGLHRNLEPWCHEIIPVQVSRVGPWGHEGTLRARQRRLCAAAGATWVLFVDPDERIEDAAVSVVPEALAGASRRDVFGFHLREMWTPTAYRVDGGWANKKPRRRLIHLRHGVAYPNKPIHCGLAPLSGVRSRVTLPLNLYHLKGIEPENRVARAQAFVDTDPLRKQSDRGNDWAWLYDETGLETEEIPEGRGFSPPYEPRSYFFVPPGTGRAGARARDRERVRG